MQTDTPVKAGRRFLPADLSIESWNALEPFFQELLNRELPTAADLQEWVLDLSEMEAVLSEETGWRYIRMCIDTTDEENRKAFEFLVTEIDPKVAPYSDRFNHKLLDSPFVDSLATEGFDIHLRSVRKQVEMFREKNIPLQTEVQQLQQKYGAMTGAMTIEHDGERITLQKAANLLKSTDSALREQVYMKISAERLSKADELDTLFTDLVKLRHSIARNADYANYRDYKLDALGRFDYGLSEVLSFHEAIAAECTPILRRLDAERKEQLGVDSLRPWDHDVDPQGREGLLPFSNEDELIEKTTECFDRIRPSFGQYLRTMREMGHLDLGSRIGKSPGGFNYPLYETGVPFIFMNSVGNVRDLVTMVHEGGHAVHSFLSRDLEITPFKSLTSEIAELASMGMELISLDHWDVFFSDPEELRRAKKEHLAKVLYILPWTATVDSFQHWAYQNPEHTVEQRDAAWTAIQQRFASDVTDWSGLDRDLAKMWQRQLHIFEVPFYYIEYAIAQLGAIALWRNYRKDPEQALDRYEAALSLGYTRPIGQIYEEAGISFDFSASYVRQLMAFVWDEYRVL